MVCRGHFFSIAFIRFWGSMSWVWALIQVCSSFAFWAPLPSMVPCVLVLFLSQILLYWIYVSLILLEIHHWALDSLCGPYTKQQHTLVLNKETRGVFFIYIYTCSTCLSMPMRCTTWGATLHHTRSYLLVDLVIQWCRTLSFRNISVYVDTQSILGYIGE